MTDSERDAKIDQLIAKIEALSQRLARVERQIFGDSIPDDKSAPRWEAHPGWSKKR